MRYAAICTTGATVRGSTCTCQADESVEETNPNAQLARAALNSLHVVRTKSVLTCGCKGMQKSSSFPVRDGKRVLFRMIFFLLQGGVEQSMLTGSCLVSWISFPAPPASIPNPLARSELDFEMVTACRSSTQQNTRTTCRDPPKAIRSTRRSH